MSLFGNISILNQAMRNYQFGLNVVSDNVANAATPGYSRQRLALEQLPPLAEGPLQFGTGTMATVIERLRDNFLDNQMRLQLNDLGRSQARQASLTDLGAIFPEVANPLSSLGIQGALDAVTNAWTALAAAPTSAAAQTTTRDALDNLAKLLNTDSRLCIDFQANLDREVVNTVDQINVQLDQIAAFNSQIALARAGGQGRDPNSLLDAREQAAEKLSLLIDSSFRVTDDGTMTVIFNGGVLVDHGQSYKLATIPSPTDPGRTAVAYRKNFQNLYTNVSSQIHGGRLGGLLQTRDIDAEDARLALDKIAYGMIQRSNEINRTAISSTDSTTNHAIFTGTKASDIQLDPILRTNVSYIGSTRDASVPGDVATLQAALKRILMFSDIESSPLTNIQVAGQVIDPTLSISSQIAKFQVTPGAATAGSPGSFVIAAGGVAKTFTWDGSMSINAIIKDINTQGAGAFYATYDQTSQKMKIYSSSPLTVYDVNFSFARAMKLSAVATSSAPINNSPLSTLNPISGVVPLNNTSNLLNLYTGTFPTPPAPSTYTIKVDSTNIAWLPTDDFPTILGNITAANTIASGKRVSAVINLNTQIISLIHVGDTVFNTGTLSAGNPMTSVKVSDVTGNLTRVFNFDTGENSYSILSEFTTAIASRSAAETVTGTQAQALVDQTTQLQDTAAGVDLNEEMAQARLYQRSYEASVRLQGIIDEMLNVLINHMGSSTISSSSSI